MPGKAFYRIAQQPDANTAEYALRAHAFEDSFYRDSEGNYAGYVGGRRTANYPSDSTGLALWKDPDSDQEVLRRPDGKGPPLRGDVEWAPYSQVPSLYVDGAYIPMADLVRNPDGTFSRFTFSPKPEAPANPQTLLAKQYRASGTGVIGGSARTGAADAPYADTPVPAFRAHAVPTDNRTITRLENFGVTTDTFKAMPYEQQIEAINAATNAEYRGMIEGYNAATRPSFDASRIRP